MKAITYDSYGPPEVLTVSEVETPSPAADEVLVRVHAVAITSAESAFRSGSPWIARLFMGLFKPKQAVLGSEFSGVIAAVGSDVTGFNVGDLVYGSTGDALGSYAQFVCVRADSALTLAPRGLSAGGSAALSYSGLTALPFLRDKGMLGQSPTDADVRVLINGAAGPIGTTAIQLATHLGATVTAVCSRSNFDLVRRLGASDVVDYTEQDYSRSDQHYDIVFDVVAKSSFWRARRVLKKRGRYLTTVPTPGALFHILWTALFSRKKALFAATGLRKPELQRADLVTLRELVEAHALTPVIDRHYDFDDIVAAHTYIDQPHRSGNVVMQTLDRDEAA